MSIPAGSLLHGVAVFELRLLSPTVVTLIVRDSATTLPGHDTVLRVGDELLLITTPKVRQAAERRLRAVGRRGKLARWLGEHGEHGDPATRRPPNRLAPDYREHRAERLEPGNQTEPVTA